MQETSCGCDVAGDLGCDVTGDLDCDVDSP